MVTFATTAEINRYIDSELDYNNQLIYVVEFVGDDGETQRQLFYDHAAAFAFVRDEVLGYSAS